MTPIAGEASMFSFEDISGLRVVESFDIQFHQCKVFAVVLGVAGDALQTRTSLDVVGSVQAFSSSDARAYFTVTVDATEGRPAGGESVARGTAGCAIQGLVRAGKRAR
jgi:hypothetical protein